MFAKSDQRQTTLGTECIDLGLHTIPGVRMLNNVSRPSPTTRVTVYLFRICVLSRGVQFAQIPKPQGFSIVSHLTPNQAPLLRPGFNFLQKKKKNPPPPQTAPSLHSYFYHKKYFTQSGFSTNHLFSLKFSICLQQNNNLAFSSNLFPTPQITNKLPGVFLSI